MTRKQPRRFGSSETEESGSRSRSKTGQASKNGRRTRSTKSSEPFGGEEGRARGGRSSSRSRRRSVEE